MATYLSIGDFSRATHLTVKTLRHYHQIGLLEPAHIDPYTGYRRYSADQLPLAHIIRRFRDLDMPLEQIASVLNAPDLKARNARITAHLAHLEDELSRTQRAVTALRDLLAAPSSSPLIEIRTVPSTAAAAITETVDAEDSVLWLQGALAELRAALAAQGISTAGVPGGVFSDDLFTHHRGESTVFLPCDLPSRPIGRVTPTEIPAAELAVITHTGPPSDVDRAYGALAAYVTQHALAVAAPVREYYLAPERTEIAWPVFHTTTPTSNNTQP